MQIKLLQADLSGAKEALDAAEKLGGGGGGGVREAKQKLREMTKQARGAASVVPTAAPAASGMWLWHACLPRRALESPRNAQHFLRDPRSDC